MIQPERTHHDLTLPNGLRVVLIPRPAVHSAVATLYLRVGSRFETRDDNGLSHFLEHMVFRGTRTLESAHAQALAFERLGGMLYAATHVDHGVMSVGVPPTNLERVLDLLGEVTTSPRFADIEIERGIVREEILEDKDDDGREIDADNLARELVYEAHPLGLTITGDVEQLDRFDRARLSAHHARHYTADNAVLCVAGRLGDLDACAKQIERALGALPRGEKVTADPPPNGQKKPRFRFVENQSSQTDLRVCFRAPSERDAAEPATEMLVRVLDDGMSTRLYETICDRLGLCYDVSAVFEAYEDDGVLDVAAGVQHERAHVVLGEIFKLLHALADEGPSDDELAKARDRHLWSVDAMQDDADALAGFYGLAALAGIARTPEARHDELAAVTRADVRDAAQRIFQPDRLSVVAVGLLGGAERSRVDKLVRAF
jgi:predicted Zn-dependent peptidase